MKTSVKHTALLIASSIFLASCPSDPPKNQSEYNVSGQSGNHINLGEEQTIDGIIIDIDHSFVPYKTRPKMESSGYGNSHPITWITIKTEIDETKTLLYPFTSGFHRGRAKIKYNPVKNNKFTASAFINKYVTQDGEFDSGNMEIRTDGIIVKGGVSYDL